MSVSKIKYRNTEVYMLGFAKKLKKLMQLQLSKNRTRTYPSGRTVNAPIDNTGRLSNSFTIGFTKVRLNKMINSGQFALSIFGRPYGDKLNEGGIVKPKVSQIKTWIKKKPVDIEGISGLSKDRRDYVINSIANNIVRRLSGNTGNGIKPTYFINDAIEEAMMQIDSIAEPIEKDIHLNLDKIFDRAGYRKQGDEYVLKRARIAKRTKVNI